MKANELRIGNYVDLLGNFVKIECISKLPMRDSMYWLKCIDYVDTKIIHFKPIPLTEEWLVKLGFSEKDHEHIDYIPETYFSIKSEIGIMNINSCFEFTLDYGGEFSSSKIKYVHQLQNLYFALTGEELTIKN